MDPEESAILETFRDAGQAQVFRFLDHLSPPERRRLFEDAALVDLAEFSRLLEEAPLADEGGRDLAPLEAVGPDDPDRAAAEGEGRRLLAAGKVAFYTVAGGQGTRLGFDGPKGLYPIGPFSKKTLFQWHAEKVLAASRFCETAIPWVLLVSRENEGPTRRYFEENAWFGLEGRVRLVTQRMLPAVDEAGRILNRTTSRIALSPNGHGGSIEALDSSGALAWLDDLGVEILSYFQVDNALIDPADPAFLGCHSLRTAEMSAKVVMKIDPLEKAGIVVNVNGRPAVVEYSELSEDLARATDDEGRLVYGLANIAAHVFSVPFLRRLREGALGAGGLPHHVAVKKVLTVDDEGNPIEVTGRKFETFVFDAIPLAAGFVAFLTERSEEFSPLKNAEGDNSPETVHAALLDRTLDWYRRAGRPVPESPEDLEMSPLTAFSFESFTRYAEKAR